MAKKIYGLLRSDRAAHDVTRTGKREVSASVTYGDYGATTDGSVSVLGSGKIIAEIKATNSTKPAILDFCYNAETGEVERLIIKGTNMIGLVKLQEVGRVLANMGVRLQEGLPDGKS